MKAIIKIKPMTLNRYLRMLPLLNSPEKLTHYRKEGCLFMFRDGEMILHRAELDQFNKEEKENPLNKHWYEMQFIPFQGFELREIYHKGVLEFNHINKPYTA